MFPSLVYKPCVFPFTYNGIKYNDFTSVGTMTSNLLWCSVVDTVSVPSSWGYCAMQGKY